MGERVCGSDAGFEEALAAKGEANRLDLMSGLEESRGDRGIAARLAVPIRPLRRNKHVSNDCCRWLIPAEQLRVGWVRPPELGVETRRGCTRAWPGCGRGAEVKPHGSRDVGYAVAAVVLSHEACGVAADADHMHFAFAIRARR